MWLKHNILSGHWVFEVNKFIPSKFLKPLQYVGPPVERERLRYQVKNSNFIVASYDIVRKDIDFFSSIKWNYCVLDEGHVIKNGKTKAFKAIKQLVANHRLILSGTPIQVCCFLIFRADCVSSLHRIVVPITSEEFFFFFHFKLCPIPNLIDLKEWHLH